MISRNATILIIFNTYRYCHLIQLIIVRTCNTAILFLFVCLFFACSNDEGENEEGSISFDTYSEGYNYEACWAELRGTIRITGTPTEWGFVYSFENEIPTIDDVKMVLGGAVTTTAILEVEDYVFSEVLYWRAYAIIDGQPIYTRSNEFLERFDTFNLVSPLSLSFECDSVPRQLIINSSIICPNNIVSMEVCFTTRVAQSCEELAITNQPVRTITVGDDVIEASVSIISKDQDPDRRLFLQVIPIPNVNRFQVEEQAEMPIAVAESTGFRFGDSFYLCGGYTTSENSFTSDFWRYDIETGVWTQLQDYPGGPERFMSSVIIDDIAYVGYGGTGVGVSEFYSYNISTETWNRLADIPAARNAGISFGFGNKIYLLTFLETREVIEYDVILNRWSRLNSLPFEFNNARNMAVSHNQTGYIVNTFDDFAEIYQYDDSDDTWNIVDRPAISCNDGVAFTDDEALYITTGRGMDGVYRLDLSTFESTFFCTSNQELRSEAVGTIYNGEIFIFGGLEHDLDPQNFTRTLTTVYSLEL